MLVKNELNFFGEKVLLSKSTEVEGAEIKIQRNLRMRYRGQKHTFTVPIGDIIENELSLRSQFETYYQNRFGHFDVSAPVEIVGIHLSAYAITKKPNLERLVRVENNIEKSGTIREVYFGKSGGWLSAEVYNRDSLPQGFSASGPAIIEEYGATTVVEPGDRFEIGRLGEIQVVIGE